MKLFDKSLLVTAKVVRDPNSLNRFEVELPGRGTLVYRIDIGDTRPRMRVDGVRKERRVRLYEADLNQQHQTFWAELREAAYRQEQDTREWVMDAFRDLLED